MKCNLATGNVRNTLRKVQIQVQSILSIFSKNKQMKQHTLEIIRTN